MAEIYWSVVGGINLAFMFWAHVEARNGNALPRWRSTARVFSVLFLASTGCAGFLVYWGVTHG